MTAADAPLAAATAADTFDVKLSFLIERALQTASIIVSANEARTVPRNDAMHESTADTKKV